MEGHYQLTPLQETLKHSDRPGSISCEGSDPFPWVLGCMRFCLCPLRVKSLISPVRWRCCDQILLVFKIRFPGDSQFLGQIVRLGSLMWGLEPSQLCESFFAIIVLQFVGHQPSRIWFYGNCAPPTILLRLLLCPWTRGIILWWVPVSSCRWLFNN